MNKGALAGIIVGIVIVLVIGSFFVFHHKGSSANQSNSVKAPSQNTSGSANPAVKGTLTTNASALQQQFSGLNFSSGSAQTDTTPSQTTNMPQLT